MLEAQEVAQGDHGLLAPGNAGTAIDAQNVSIEPGDHRGLVQFAKREGVGLTVIGPEEPLAKGIVDLFQREGLRIFGPRKEAAELEGSKVFAKELMRRLESPRPITACSARRPTPSITFAREKSL